MWLSILEKLNGWSKYPPDSSWFELQSNSDNSDNKYQKKHVHVHLCINIVCMYVCMYV